MIDDFSELPEDAMKVVVDALFAPLNNWSNEFIKFKVAAYPNRIYYGDIDRTKIDEVYLDLFYLFGTSDVTTWSALAMARTTPVLLGLCSRVTVRAWRLRGAGGLLVPQTAWSHTAEPIVADGLALVRQHLWPARSVGHSPPAAESMPCPPEACDLLIHGLPFAA